MLKFFIVDSSFLKFCQSGFYFDFFYKKFNEVFIRNFFIYSSQFFGEKYFIEVLTKRVFDETLYYSNKLISWNVLFYSWFFNQILLIIFYFFIFLNFIFLFF